MNDEKNYRQVGADQWEAWGDVAYIESAEQPYEVEGLNGTWEYMGSPAPGVWQYWCPVFKHTQEEEVAELRAAAEAEGLAYDPPGWWWRG